MYFAAQSLKLVPPQPLHNEVHRPRLLEMLDEAVQRPVTLISAGPGSGKTVLVNQWSRSRSHAVVWVSLDRGDDREARFWTLVQYALQHNGLAADGLAADPGRSLAEHAIDQVAEMASRADDLLVLVLDDVHVLHDPEVFGTLDVMLRHPPPNLRVIITTRSDPMIPLHRYRIQGNLSEIRAAELAMTIPEVEQLLAVHDIRLPAAQVAMLAERTEGWVAGLRLLAMRMEGSAEPERLVTDFAMDRGSIGEYLMEEVLSMQPPAVRSLLIRSSICDPVSGPLADAIAESESGAAILGELAATNRFVLVLDHKGGRFRYHPLLREVLQHLLNREPAAVQRRGHLNAARWHDSDGDLVEALRHAVTAHDWAYCADLLIRGAFEELFLRASVRPLTGIGRFVDATPADEATVGLDLRPDACASGDVVALQAAVAAALGRQDRAATLLDSLDLSQVGGGAALLLAFAQLLVAHQAANMTAFEAAYTVLVEHDPQGPFGPFARYEMGSLFLWQGSDDLADRLLHQALKQATAQSLNAIALRCVGRLAILHCSAGRVSVAEELIGQGTTLLQAHPWIPESFRVAYHLGAAEVAVMRGDQEIYSRCMRLVDAELAPQADPALSCMTALIQAKALQTAGRYAEAHQLLQTNTGRELPAAWLLRTRAEILLLELQAQMGNLRRVVTKLERVAQVNEATTNRALLALARAHLQTGDCDAVNPVVRRIITSHHAPPLPVLIETKLLSAELADAEHQETAAVEAATAAVQLASSERIMLPFIAAGPRLREVLERHPALSKLWPAPLDATAGQRQWARDLPAKPEDMALAEPLTQREVSILNWLTTPLTMAEIAAELSVSTNTVKTHVGAIYRKLEAKNRREAIARGRQLRLI